MQSDIIRCESEINYTRIFLKYKQKLLVAKTLKEFEEMLADYNFYRVHNSHLINLAYIKSYNKGKGGSVIMEDGSELEVSTRRKEEFLKRLMNT
jgi:two-component system, LytTR family, response regulator